MMAEITTRKDRRQILPSEKCPKCSCWVHPSELAANGGVCIQCYPAAGYTLGIYDKVTGEPKVVNDGR